MTRKKNNTAPKIDMQTFDGLEQLRGTLAGATVFVYDNGVAIAISVEGEVFALNHRSEDPYYINSRQRRMTWARCVGVTGREVEAYVRRKRKRKNGERLEAKIKHAYALLEVHAGIVKALKAKGELA